MKLFEDYDTGDRQYKDFNSIRETFEFISEHIKEVDKGYEIGYNKNGRMPVKNGLVIGWLEEIKEQKSGL